MSPTDEHDLELMAQLRPEPTPDDATVAHHRTQLQTAIRAATDGSPAADAELENRSVSAEPSTRGSAETVRHVTTYGVTPLPDRRRGMTVLVAAAAAAVLVVAVGVVERWGGEPDDDAVTMRDPSVASGSVAPAAPEGLPAPTAAPPDGLTLWGVAWAPLGSGSAGGVNDGDWTQLFGVEGDPGARILLEDGVEGEGEAVGFDWSNPVATVRGQEAVVTEYTDGAYGHEVLAWREADHVGLAAFRGMTAAEAAAAVDTLEHRPGGWGYDAPSGGPLTLLGESETDLASDPTVTRAEFTYAAGVPDAADGPEAPGEGMPSASVQTTQGTGSVTRAYLHTWFAGERADDGRVTSSIPQSGMIGMVWPDGRMAGGETSGGVSLTSLERLVASAQPASSGQLVDLWSEANDRLTGLPLVADAEVGPGAVELRGEGGRPQTLCLRLAAGTACTAPGLGLSGGGTGTFSGDVPAIVVGLPVGEEWYVAVAAPDGVDIAFQPDDLPVAEAGAARWRVSLAQPPNGVDEVVVDHGDTGRSVYRPGTTANLAD